MFNRIPLLQLLVICNLTLLIVWHLRILPSLEVSQLVTSSTHTDSVTLWVVWALLSPLRCYDAFKRSQGE